MIDEYRQKAQGLISHFQEELKHIRTGRAQSSLVEGMIVEVESYGGAQMKLSELASISTPDATLLIIQPFDPSVLKDIEKAFHTSNLGLSPVVDQRLIRIAIPPLTAERRQQMTKLVAQKAEEAKIAIRNLRSQIKEDIEAQEKLGGFSEDDIKRQLEELQKEVDQTSEQIDQLKAEKEKDVLTV